MKNTRVTIPARRTPRRKMLRQRLLGLLLLTGGVLALWMGSTAPALRDRDGTAAVLLAAFGLWLLFTKKPILDKFWIFAPCTGRRPGWPTPRNGNSGKNSPGRFANPENLL